MGSQLGDTLNVTFASPSQRELDELVEAHMHVVHHVVRDVSSRLPAHVDVDDLVSAGYAGLVQAAKSFDESTGVPFARWASRRIRGAVIDELRAMDWASRQLRSKQKSISATEAELTAKLGRHPTHAEVAEQLGISVTELNRQRAQLDRQVMSLDCPASAGVQVQDDGRTPDDHVLLSEQWAELREAINVLPQRLRDVLLAVYIEQKPLGELAEELGVSPSRVSQLRAEAVKALRGVVRNRSFVQNVPSQRSGSSSARDTVTVGGRKFFIG